MFRAVSSMISIELQTTINMAEKVKAQEEDVVDYLLFPPIPQFLDDHELVAYLEEQLDLYLAHLSDVLLGYIWQNDHFNLRVVASPGKHKMTNDIRSS